MGNRAQATISAYSAVIAGPGFHRAWVRYAHAAYSLGRWRQIGNRGNDPISAL